MSFGSGGFGGFGSNNNQQSTFGGFGSNNNNNSGGFGSNTNTGGSIFGGSNNNNNTGGSMFGSNTSTPFGGGGGFGSNNNTSTTFGSKPFGSTTTGGGLFGGGSTSNTTFGGFGSTNNNNTTTTSAFGGGSNTGGGMFGQNKSTGFGSTNNTGGGLFGGGSTSGGFGTTNNTTGGFGSSTTGGFGANTNTNNGTAGTPFQPFSEKDTTGSQQYQTITFQQPYANFSLEELRCVDYAQGRKFGNQNGQPGAFGQSTGFGGFGANNNTTTNSSFGANNTNTGGGLFGNQNNNTNTGFGTNNTTSTFGNNNNSGGLFGANKPAGGLFGSNTTTQSGTTGGLFGSTPNTTGAFGSTPTNNAFNSSTNTGGGLFGQNNATQNKPFGGFGSNSNTTNTTSSTFGSGATNNGGGLFGQSQTSSTPGFGANTTSSNTGGGLFGNNNTSTTGGGLFGQTQQNQSQPSGGLFGGSLGQNNQNQQKPSLFGNTSTNTGGGLFGGNNNNNNSNTGGGLFGQNQQTQNKPGGLFGGATNQPATGGLFGNSTTNTSNSGGGLFGGLGAQNNTQQNTGNSLFGASNNQSKPSLFGASTATNTNTGGGLFSGLNQNNANAGALGTGQLFGGSQSQQQTNQQPMNNSLFGASGNSLLNTSMTTNPYGNDPLFAGLSTPMQSPGPLATPLSTGQKHKKSAILPQHKLNPSASTRLLTPQGKRNGGYGFTYSTYGTPSSTQSSPLGGSMFGGGSLSRHLGKSLSSSNLRNSYTADTSVLAPGAFSMTSRQYGTGSLKKLSLNRTLNQRPSLFEDPPQKRVSFAAVSPETVTNGSTVNGEASPPSNALIIRDEEVDASPPIVNGTSSTKAPEMEQVNGVDATPVPESRTLQPRTSASLNVQNGQTIDPTPGGYWMEPSMNVLKKMSPGELKSVSNFVVGREKIGKIEFNNGKPVDLSSTPLDKIFDNIVVLEHRTATVYGGTCTVPKPLLGSGLNHPSRITLGNSWPRGANRPGKNATKHIERLKRVPGTEFEKYDAETGDWVFRVPHFSSYGFEYDLPEDNESSELSPVPETPARLGSSQMTSTPQDSIPSATQSSPDDTFDFKRGMSRRANVPGQFDNQAVYEVDDEEMVETNNESFLGDRSVGSLDSQHDYTEASGFESVEDQDMADSVSGSIRTTEQDVARQSDSFKNSAKPKSILKGSQLFRTALDTPSKATVFDDDWANALQRTISPRKQNRQALRESQGDALRERGHNTANLAQSLGAQNTNSNMSRMDLYESIFGQTTIQKESTTKRVGHGIQIPYAKRPKTASDLDQLADADKEFHSSGKPHFSETGVLVYTGKGAEATGKDLYICDRPSIVSAHTEIRFKKMPTFPDATSPTIRLQQESTRLMNRNEVPKAILKTDPIPVDFSRMADVVVPNTTARTEEQKAWQLLSLLFDDAESAPPGVSDKKQWVEQNRKERLSRFWQSLVFEDAQKHAKEASTHEEKALAYLSCNSIADAITTLFHGSDVRLATMVSQLGGDVAMREDMREQIDEWRNMDFLAEMDDTVRALYELVRGETAQAEGKGGQREDKALTFQIASRFKLDWRRAFGLRLWYQTTADENIEMAVAQFTDAMRHGTEDVKPVPWFIAQGLDMGWDDPQKDQREDLLWGILKLYAYSKADDIPANIEDVLAPANVSGHPLNARLSFQLFQMFWSRQHDQTEEEDRMVPMPTSRPGTHSGFLSSVNSTRGDDQAEDPQTELGDQLTLTYAASLHTAEHWTTAVWVYTHLSSPAARENHIRSLLNQFSSTYELARGDATCHVLGEMDIPWQWVHAAAAIQAKAEGASVRQATHLIKAHELQDAHQVLCRSVGPEAIISRHLDPLRELLGDFESSYSHARDAVAGWMLGGQIYFDYIHLLDLTEQRNPYRPDDKLNDDIHGLLRKLQQSLEKVATDRWDNVSLEERVALSEIAGTVANLMAKNKLTDRASVLKLPLTEDLWLRHSVDLSASYYRNVVR